MKSFDEITPGQMVWRVLWLFLLATFLMSAIGYTVGWFSEGATVVQNELGPKALLRKYEWFKDASAQLDSQRANINVYDARMRALTDPPNPPFAQWPRDLRQEYFQIQSEVAGTKAAYNTLAAEYNSEMAKINWRFANVGQLPQGADQVLPREYRPYEVK